MSDPIKINFRPGIDRETTNYGNTGGWYDCNLARVKTGTWSSIGGWQAFTNAPMLGTQRSLFPWSTLNGARYYGVGTNLKYYIIRGNQPVDITPIRRTVTLANNPFTTVGAGSHSVTVTDVNNGSVVNDFVTYSGSSGTISGIPAGDFNIEHQITSIVDADHYTITVTTAAAAGGVSGGGAAVVADYQINVGLDTTVLGNGWGTGPWGAGGWGEGSNTSVVTDQLRLWSQDNFGEDLLYNVRDGGVYYKDMSGGVSIRGVNITSLAGASNPPIIGRQVLVSNNDRHTIVFAANTIDTVIQDRLLARWADTESLIQWTPDTTNTAGSIRFDNGSEFIRAIETTTEILVFTDTALFSMRYLGPPFIFGQTVLATNIQLIGPNAVTSTGAITAWMANGLFQWYDGVVHDMPCNIRTYVFSILNTMQTEKIFAGINRQFKEFIWLMPVNGSSENNFYVICNYEDTAQLTWYFGAFNNMGRTTWLDATFEQTPLAGATDGYIYEQDIGATDQATNPASMLDSYLTSSVFELGNGENFMLVSRTIPDISFEGSTTSTPAVDMTFARRDYPGSPFVDGPVDPVLATTVDQYTTKIDKRWRSRSTQIGIATTETGTLWSLGVPRLYASPDGQR